MTKQELLDFCVENAGKKASGKYRMTAANGLLKQQGVTNKVMRGRIIAFTIDQHGNGLILLEDANGKEKKDLPDPLPAIPHFMDGWMRLISPARLGFPCYADSVVVDEQVSDAPADIHATRTAQAHGYNCDYCQDQGGGVQGDTCISCGKGSPAKQVKRICMHDECDPGWCHRSYTGVI